MNLNSNLCGQAEAAQHAEMVAYLKGEDTKKETLIDELTTQLNQPQNEKGLHTLHGELREAQSELLSLKGERDMLVAALKAKESRLEEVQRDC